MTRYLIAFVLLILAAYGIFEARPLIVGPSLSVSSPANGETFPSGIVEVSGRVARASVLTLDGAPILPDQDGTFSSTLTFPRGSSILTLAAADRFGRTITKTRTIFVP